MNKPTTSFTVRVAEGLAGVESGVWDACANPAGRSPGAADAAFDPFLSHAFLSALEESGSVAPQTGWMPYHLLLEDCSGALRGVMPLYLKGHSQGEYIFDFAWADAFERAGGRYYPKLLAAVPFTPVTGRRLLVRGDDADPSAVEEALVAGLVQLCGRIGVSGIHVNFIDRPLWERLGAAGFLQRTHQQFHWLNEGYRCFDDFLAALSSKKRKNVRRERRDALAGDVVIERLSGADINESHWDAFYGFYMDTGSRKWGAPYLNREFFSLVGERMAEDVLLVMCRRGDRYVAGAINFIGSESLYGRNWGCIEHHPFLHFEVCYYQAIEFAIERGLAQVEAGAQGEHKLARGYLPRHTYSAHWIAHAGLREAVGGFLDSERGYVDEDIDLLAAHSPFRSQDDATIRRD